MDGAPDVEKRKTRMNQHLPVCNSFLGGPQLYPNGPNSFLGGPQLYPNGPNSLLGGPQLYPNGPNSFLGGPQLLYPNGLSHS
jgi:hypothetical protein